MSPILSELLQSVGAAILTSLGGINWEKVFPSFGAIAQSVIALLSAGLQIVLAKLSPSSAAPAPVPTK